jgi:hypothetical protein
LPAALKSLASTRKSQSENSVADPSAREPTSRILRIAGSGSTQAMIRSARFIRESKATDMRSLNGQRPSPGTAPPTGARPVPALPPRSRRRAFGACAAARPSARLAGSPQRRRRGSSASSVLARAAGSAARAQVRRHRPSAAARTRFARASARAGSRTKLPAAHR